MYYSVDTIVSSGAQYKKSCEHKISKAGSGGFKEFPIKHSMACLLIFA